MAEESLLNALLARPAKERDQSCAPSWEGGGREELSGKGEDWGLVDDDAVGDEGVGVCEGVGEDVDDACLINACWAVQRLMTGLNRCNIITRCLIRRFAVTLAVFISWDIPTQGYTQGDSSTSRIGRMKPGVYIQQLQVASVGLDGSALSALFSLKNAHTGPLAAKLAPNWKDACPFVHPSHV